MLDLNPLFLFIGNSDVDRFGHLTAVYLNIEQTMAVLSSQKGKFDLCELCGGEARVTKVAICRQTKVVNNFDIVCDIDPNDKTVQRDTMQHIRVHQPLVAVMVPMFIPYGR